MENTVITHDQDRARLIITVLTYSRVACYTRRQYRCSPDMIDNDGHCTPPPARVGDRRVFRGRSAMRDDCTHTRSELRALLQRSMLQSGLQAFFDISARLTSPAVGAAVRQPPGWCTVCAGDGSDNGNSLSVLN